MRGYCAAVVGKPSGPLTLVLSHRGRGKKQAAAHLPLMIQRMTFERRMNLREEVPFKIGKE